MIDYTRDTHIHTNYSPDADKNATFSKYIEKAKKMGLTEIIFTDHMDFDPVHPIFKTPINYDSYINDLRKYDKKEETLSVKLGVEIGYQKHVQNKIKQFLQTYSFEHIILSIHYLEKKDLYTGEFFEGKTKKTAYTIYFETLLEAVQNMDQYDVVGHFDYITRYSPFGDYDFIDYKDIIDQILYCIIKKNKGIEINTSGIQTENRTYPKKEVIQRYIELGGTKIVLGSDAHHIKELGRYFKEIFN